MHTYVTSELWECLTAGQKALMSFCSSLQSGIPKKSPVLRWSSWSMLHPRWPGLLHTVRVEGQAQEFLFHRTWRNLLISV